MYLHVINNTEMDGIMIVLPLSNTVLQYVTRQPPSPDMITNNPTLMSHLFASESEREPGLLFMREESTLGDLVAVGVYCKWSDPANATALNSTTLSNTYTKFKSMMVSRGWREDQLVFVVLANRDVAWDVVNTTTPTNIAVLSRDAIKHWLGPSL